MCGIIAGCCTAKKSQNTQKDQAVTRLGPKIIIYQTKKDYSKLVPVMLSDDKKTIVSYPDIRDVYYNGSLAYPTPLHQGFLLDNRGINGNVAFLNLSYEEYSKLAKTPTSEELMKMIIDKDPISKMYVGGVKTSDAELESDLNSKIDSNDFSSFIKIK